MEQTLKEKLAKIYAMLERGTTDGERTAAKTALDKILKRYNIEDIDLTSIALDKYYFKYTSALEEKLLIRLGWHFLDNNICTDGRKETNGVKQIRLMLTYPDYVVLSSAYEYFRRHMKEQWNKTCLQEVKKKRKAKTANKCRQQLQQVFFEQYVIKSRLIEQSMITTTPLLDLSQKQIREHKLLHGIEGGKYHTQVQTGHLLN